MRYLLAATLLATSLLVACPGEHDHDHDTPADGGTGDAGSGDGGQQPAPDSGTPDSGTGDTQAPAVESSTPAEGSTGLYPAEAYRRPQGGQAVLSYRKVLTLRFSKPMDTSVATVTLHDKTDTSVEVRSFTGEWSADVRTLTVTVTAPESGGPPLEGERAYALDLRALKDAAGNALAPAPVVGDGRLDFETAPDDPLLNHACGHVLMDSATPVSASATASPSSPRTDQTHQRYEVTLPASGNAYAGATRLRLVSGTDYVLFLDREVPVALSTQGGAAVALDSSTAPPACAGITHQVRFTTPADRDYYATFGPLAGPTVHLLLELAY
jgi:hypothetical protein